MPLSVTAATTEYLTSITTLKVELGLSTAATTDDARLTATVARASDWAERFVGYALRAQKYRETLAGFGTRRLMLGRTPVRSVAALFYGTDTGEDATEFLDSTEYGLDAEPGFLTRVAGWEWSVPVEQEITVRPQPGQEFTPWLVDYVAGYTLDGVSTGSALWSTAHGTTSTSRTLPYDIEQAVLLKAAGYWLGNENVVEKAVGDLRIRYATRMSGGGGVDDQAAALLGPYRRSA